MEHPLFRGKAAGLPRRALPGRSSRAMAGKAVIVGTAFALFGGAAGIAAAESPRPGVAAIHLVGDSTMCVYRAEHAPLEGWGMRLPALCRKGVAVRNHAVAGRSTKSFESRGEWGKVLPEIKPGDFVVIGMGINDGSPKETRPLNHTDTGGEFEGNLARWISAIRGRGGIPLLTTTTVIWAEKGLTAPDPLRERYNRAIRETAAACRCDVVDLHGEAFRRFAAMKPDEVSAFYLADRNDYCHLNGRGADFYARLFVELCKKAELPIASLFE